MDHNILVSVGIKFFNFVSQDYSDGGWYTLRCFIGNWYLMLNANAKDTLMYYILCKQTDFLLN